MNHLADVTGLFLEPATGAIDDSLRDRLRDRLVSGIAPVVEGLPAGEPVVVSLPLLRRARARPDAPLLPEEPFVWKPAFAGVHLGLAVVDACVDGRFRHPDGGHRPGVRRGRGGVGANRVAHLPLGTVVRPAGPGGAGRGAGRGAWAGPLRSGRPSTGTASPASPGRGTRRPVDVPGGSGRSVLKARSELRVPLPGDPSAVARGGGRPADGAGLGVRRLPRGRLGRGAGLPGPGGRIALAVAARSPPGWWACGPMPASTPPWTWTTPCSTAAAERVIATVDAVVNARRSSGA